MYKNLTICKKKKKVVKLNKGQKQMTKIDKRQIKVYIFTKMGPKK